MMKRAALFVVIGVVSLATLPYSLAVLLVGGGVVWYRRRNGSAMVPTASQVDFGLDALERRLAAAIRETEAQTRTTYTAWKLSREKEKQYFLAHGVTLPRTDLRAREDEMFSRLEQRMKEEQQRFEDEARRIERQEHLRLEDHRRQEDDERIAAQQRELELARIQAEHDAVAALAKALHQDMG